MSAAAPHATFNLAEVKRGVIEPGASSATAATCPSVQRSR